MLLLTAVGCARSESTYEITLPAAGIFDAYMDADRGDITYAGAPLSDTAEIGSVRQFDVSITSWGKGRTKGRAERRAANNTFGATVSEEWLDVWGRSGVGRAGTDLSVNGPRIFNVEAVTLNGTVRLVEVDGYHTVTATRVEGEGVVGDIDALADGGGIDLDITPYEGSIVRLETIGDDLVVALPANRDYDLQIFADPEYGYEVADLGFDDLLLGPDYVYGTKGDASVRVTLLASGGVISVLEAL